MSIDDPDMTAAELALGLLESDERAAAKRRVLADPAFAAEVDRWRLRFAAMFARGADVAPPAALLGRIETSLSAERTTTVPLRRRWLWPSIAAVSSLAAAILLFIVLDTPAPVVAPRTPAIEAQLAAAVVAAERGQALTAIYSPGAGELRVTGAALADASHAAELWVIGRDGVPHSLGLLRPGRTTALKLAAIDRPRLVPAAVLAVSIEPLGGSPTGLPTGPVVATGALART